MECVVGLGVLFLAVSGIFGLGWLVIAPLGAISRLRVKQPRFQLLDLFWLLLLLQPLLVFVGFMFRDQQGRHSQWIMIYILLAAGIAAAWYAMTGALSKAGVTGWGKRASAVLVILPMVGAINPLAVLVHFFVVAYLVNESISLAGVIGFGVAELAYVASLIGCRRLSRWIASGATDSASGEIAIGHGKDPLAS